MVANVIVNLHDVKADFKQMTKWTLDMVDQLPELAVLKDRCQICGSKKGLRLRCVGGFMPEPLVIVVCRDCGKVLSNRRTAWDQAFHNHPRLRAPCQAYALYDLVNIFKLKARKTGNKSYDFLAYRLAEQFKGRRNN
jgi:hypothetical protein